jgi:quercetin dioxygenase-like cupin family protein
MKVVHLYSDVDGMSHFADLDVSLAPSAYAPPAPPIEVSERIPATNAVLFSMPAGWFGDWHPSPHRQLYINFSGHLEVSVSDGETRVFGPGDIVLVEDLLPPGHTTRTLGGQPSTGIFVHLAEVDPE